MRSAAGEWAGLGVVPATALGSGCMCTPAEGLFNPCCRPEGCSAAAATPFVTLLARAGVVCPARDAEAAFSLGIVSCWQGDWAGAEHGLPDCVLSRESPEVLKCPQKGPAALGC